MWAKNATPPPACGWTKLRPPSQIWRPIQTSRNQKAGISRMRMIPKKITVRTRARGKSTKYAPRTPAIAPLAPMFGMLAALVPANSRVIAVCSANAARPAARYQARKPTEPIASSTLLPKIQRNSMFPRMCSQLACMNIPVKTPSYQGSAWKPGGRRHGPSTAHG